MSPNIYQENGESWMDDPINGTTWHVPSNEPCEEIDNWINNT